MVSFGIQFEGAFVGPKLDNAAGRLHAILSKLEGETNAEHMLHIWARALDVDSDDLPELFVRLGKVYALPGQIAADMRNVPASNPREVTRWRVPLTKALAVAHVSASWQVSSPHFTQSILDDIEVCSDRLSHFLPEPHLNQSQLDDIVQQIEFLQGEVDSAPDISDSLRNSISQRLERIKQSTKDVWIDGTGKVKAEIEAAVGTVVVEHETQTGQAKKLMNAVGWGLVQVLRIAQVWDMVQGNPQLPFFTEPESPAISDKSGPGPGEDEKIIDVEVTEVTR